MLSRRRFLALGAGGAAGWTATEWSRLRPPGLPARAAILDLDGECVLRESITGYAQALGRLGIQAHVVRREWIPRSGLMIVPAAGALDHGLGGEFRWRVESGGMLLFESAAAYLDTARYRAQESWLRDHWGLRIGVTVDLGEAFEDEPRVPYLDYNWPVRVKVRDFSRAVPVVAQPGEGIASAGALPLGVRRRAGKGCFVFLGSPLGPVLAAGDREAKRWLKAIATAA